MKELNIQTEVGLRSFAGFARLSQDDIHLSISYVSLEEPSVKFIRDYADKTKKLTLRYVIFEDQEVCYRFMLELSRFRQLLHLDYNSRALDEARSISVLLYVWPVSERLVSLCLDCSACSKKRSNLLSRAIADNLVLEEFSVGLFDATSYCFFPLFCRGHSLMKLDLVSTILTPMEHFCLQRFLPQHRRLKRLGIRAFCKMKQEAMKYIIRECASA